MATGKDEATCPLTKAHITPLGDFAYPAIPGKPFANLNMDSLPPELPAEAGPTPFPDAHLTCDPKAGTITATTVGIVEATDKTVKVTPLWSVSADRMTLTMDFYPQDCFGNPISDDNYRDWLPEGTRGVDNDALDDAVAEAKKNGAAVSGVEIAQGRKPTDGRDGQVQLKIKESKDVGTIKNDGSVDFRERGGSQCVDEGETVATLVPPSSGKPGFDVLGKELPAKNGQPKTVKTGTGISTADGGGGSTVFKATEAGMVVHKDGTLSISNVIEVNSDVDLATGNMHAPKGSIFIKGTVTTGSEVSAKENVVIDVVVENATIKAGADVNVGGGILMDEGGLIEAGGNITAKFIRNATIRAGGDVIVEVDIVNCDIIAGGRIIAESDKGIINGGTYVCGGMDAAEVGTDGGTTTEITIALPGREDAGFDDKVLKIRERIEELEKYIGTEDIKSTLLMAPKEDRNILAELFKIKAKFLSETVKIDQEKKEMLEARGKELAKIKLKARKTAHAGTTINIGGKSIRLTKAEQASRFHWDPEQGGIAISGI